MTAAPRTRTTMWEVRATAGRTEELLDWVLARAPEPAQLYRSADRVVVIDPTGTAAAALADPPAELVARPPHAWPFEPVPR